MSRNGWQGFDIARLRCPVLDSNLGYRNQSPLQYSGIVKASTMDETHGATELVCDHGCITPVTKQAEKFKCLALVLNRLLHPIFYCISSSSSKIKYPKRLVNPAFASITLRRDVTIRQNCARSTIRTLVGFRKTLSTLGDSTVCCSIPKTSAPCCHHIPSSILSYHSLRSDPHSFQVPHEDGHLRAFCSLCYQVEVSQEGQRPIGTSLLWLRRVCLPLALSLSLTLLLWW